MSASQINTNIQAQQSLLNLQNTNEELATRRERLSTGLRINSAEDDAAGFEIAAQLEAKIGGQEQASRNIADAKSMLGVAEGGLDSQLNILQEMKSKAVQAANDSLGSKERDAIQNELDALTSELNDIAKNTSFNGTNLLDGSVSSGTSDLQFQTGAEKGESFSTNIAKTKASAIGDSSGSRTIGDGSGNFQGQGSGNTLDARSSGNVKAVKTIDNAIDTVSSELSDIGATQNRLSFKQENLETSTKNLDSAQSQIQDADLAKEQTQVAKLQVLQQSGTAQLAQANAASQSVLSLLG
ncbi:flagellin [Salinibacter ruber]|uniref:flagellin N-terminal helical domain-containing protein n=1 Tax=Salinibacter ruber TaxID=146919 RepID=UPI00216AAEB4|nr:flagellin [Salinibacter ruber]MCS3696434.1 flagellin [Salinibacter ruber]